MRFFRFICLPLNRTVHGGSALLCVPAFVRSAVRNRSVRQDKTVPAGKPLNSRECSGWLVQPHILYAFFTHCPLYAVQGNFFCPGGAACRAGAGAAPAERPRRASCGAASGRVCLCRAFRRSCRRGVPDREPPAHLPFRTE